MNQVGQFYVKANYIKAAKDDWVPCEVRMLTDEVDAFLCIKSKLYGVDEDMKSILSGVSTGSQMPQQLFNGSTPPRPFTALCNLSEYKSCSVLTVSVNGAAHFALKLVPAGIFGNKRLYLAMDNENEVTSWMTVIKACLGKKRKQGVNPMMLSRDSLVAVGTGTLRKTESQDTLRMETNVTDGRYDLDMEPVDNEVYEPYSPHDVIPAVIERRGDWVKLRLSRVDCYLRLTDDRLELLDGGSQRVLHWFPYLLIRRFGAVGGVLRVDAGRRCSTGDGHFFFACNPINGQPVEALVSQIRQLALEAKARLRQEQEARQQSSNRSSIASNGIAASRPPPIPPKNDTLGKSENVARSEPNGGWITRWKGTPRSSSIPPPQRTRLEETEVDGVKLGFRSSSITSSLDGGGSLDLESRSPLKSAIKSIDKEYDEETTGVFLASPGKASISDIPKNGQPNAGNSQTRCYDNVAASESRSSLEQTTEARKLFPTSSLPRNSRKNTTSSQDSSLESSVGGDRNSWLMGSLTRMRKDSKEEFSNLPPPPPPPPSGFEDPIKTNNSSNVGSWSSSPSTAPASALQDRFNRSSVQSSYTTKPFSWMSPISCASNYTRYSLDKPLSPRRLSLTKTSPQTGVESGSRNGEYETESGTFRMSSSSGSATSPEPNDLSHINLKGLDDVLQELRSANDNVCAAVQATARNRRSYGLGTGETSSGDGIRASMQRNQ